MINTFIWLRWKTFFSHTPENKSSNNSREINLSIHSKPSPVLFPQRMAQKIMYQTIGSIRSFQFGEENRGRTIDENMELIKEVAKRL